MTTPLPVAYRRTLYQVAGHPLRIGRHSAAIDTLLRSHGVREGVLITAWNPYSRRMPPGWNHRMQRRLKQATRRIDSVAATGCWRRWSEDHLMLFISKRRAAVLAREFCQNAIVIARIGQPSCLWRTSRCVQRGVT